MAAFDDPNCITDVVAIDGPAGAGKSTAARRAAEALGFSFLDTGAMYRAATWWALNQGVNLNDPEAVVESTRRMKLEIYDDARDDPRDATPQVYVNSQDVTEAIRMPDVTRQIFKLDTNAEVREQLVALQRIFGSQGPTVAEGRDIGTVVFPKAKCKIYMAASLDERARRRADELMAKGLAVDFDALRDEIRARDEMNETRKIAPLRRAEDAVLLDTTRLTIDQVVDRVVTLARERI